MHKRDASLPALVRNEGGRPTRGKRQGDRGKHEGEENVRGEEDEEGFNAGTHVGDWRGEREKEGTT